MNHAQRLTALRSESWQELFPGKTHTIPMDGVKHECVWIFGLMHDVAREAWLCVQTGLVMMHGESRDYEFGEFLEALQVKPASVEPAARQRTLWGDEE